MAYSLRERLISSLVLPILCVWAFGGVAIFLLSADLAKDTYDAELAEQASSIATRFQIKEGLLAVDMPAAALDILTYDLSDKFYFAVAGPHGRHIAGDTSFPPPPRDLSPTRRPMFYNAVMHGTNVRVAALMLPVQKGSSQFATVQVAETLATRQDLEGKVLLTVFVPELVFVLILLGVVWTAVSAALKPLEMLTESVDRRTANDLTPLPAADVPKEVAPLMVAINRLLSRVSSDVDERSRFIGNAAHQLRTPLAGLQTQTELALRTKDEAERREILQKIKVGSERAGRLVNQLLILAKVEPNSPPLSRVPVDLYKMVTDCIEEIIESALDKGVEVNLEDETPSAGSATVYGDPVLLREMISNLLDNAIRYTPSGGVVTTKIERFTDACVLTITDTGLGIPEPEQARVFERFYRVPGAAPGGSGLGLAIVAEIASVHNVQVSLDSRDTGTCVSLRFPTQAPL